MDVWNHHRVRLDTLDDLKRENGINALAARREQSSGVRAAQREEESGPDAADREAKVGPRSWRPLKERRQCA